MGRHRRDRSGDKAEALVKLVFAFFMLIALGVGGLSGFGKVLGSLITLLIVVGASIGALVLLGWILVKVYRSTRASPISDVHTPFFRKPSESFASTTKFCAALLEADGFIVERKGGAHPDGGVDLLVEKAGTRALIQCKHWRTWHIKEDIVRGMLGSMTDFKVSQGAIYTLKGWTVPAAQFAAKHAITLVNGAELAQSAKFQLSAEKLESLLRPREHHCPKCESPMLWKTGNFTPFWGCSQFPRCRGKINHSGAR